MFQPDYQQYVSHQFPKTDSNFYTFSLHASTLQPWNKTTYPKVQHQPLKKSRHAHLKELSNHTFSSFDTIRKEKRKANSSLKCPIALSTLTIDIQQNQSKEYKNCRGSISPRLRNIKIYESAEKKNDYQSENVFEKRDSSHKGFSGTLKYMNLLKIKQQHQIKVREEINRKESQGKFFEARIRRRSCERSHLSKIVRTQIQQQNQGHSLKLIQNIRKPKKAFYVGIRKILGFNGAEKFP